MKLNSIHNGRGFFSDYWLGSVLGSKSSKAPKLQPAQTRKLIYKLFNLYQRVDIPEPLNLTAFREKFARQVMSDVFNYRILENPDDTHIRALVDIERPESKPVALILLEPDDELIDSRQTRSKIEKALIEQNINYGFIITTDILRLIRKPGLGHKNAYLDFSIATATQLTDTDSLGVAYSIFNSKSLIPDEKGHTVIEYLEEESMHHSSKVSGDLKGAVFSSAEMLIRGFLEDINFRKEDYPESPSLTDLRDASLQCLYRLLFIFYAESRDDRLQNHSIYILKAIPWKNCSNACWSSLLKKFLATGFHIGLRYSPCSGFTMKD